MAYLLLFHRNMARIFLALTPEKDLNDQIIELKKDLKESTYSKKQKYLGKKMMIIT
ncbi:MAG: hypothetical protein CM15mP86_06980 [Gammaproteobacteria bacterium]|nr:MAG: hypothetical protein CM15mP86_06980 [Gammaproteobacteria bacterium]